MYLPEHEHLETQVQTRFRPDAARQGLKAAYSSLYAPGQAHRGGWDEGWEVVVLLLEPALLWRAADELFCGDRFEIKPFSAVPAPLIEHLSAAILREFHASRAPERCYLECIGHVIAGHLLREHADTRARRSVKGRFSALQMGCIDRFIDERLGTDFGITDLAALLSLGPQRFTERFRLTVGMSPWRYVQRQRIHKAQQLLVQQQLPLAEIALRLGYCSQSHFSTAFRRVTGVTPSTYRKGLQPPRCQVSQ
jgi:AraC family transcriptional regulator